MGGWRNEPNFLYLAFFLGLEDGRVWRNEPNFGSVAGDATVSGRWRGQTRPGGRVADQGVCPTWFDQTKPIWLG
jgi:hypothetical protein